MKKLVLASAAALVLAGAVVGTGEVRAENFNNPYVKMSEKTRKLYLKMQAKNKVFAKRYNHDFNISEYRKSIRSIPRSFEVTREGSSLEEKRRVVEQKVSALGAVIPTHISGLLQQVRDAASEDMLDNILQEAESKHKESLRILEIINKAIVTVTGLDKMPEPRRQEILSDLDYLREYLIYDESRVNQLLEEAYKINKEPYRYRKYR
ncbi:hypothetical protein KVF93_08165 [Streptococcus equi subsp. zooepidemicus]|uniref:Putative exported protein n=1 Tax=Streptococcus equi subsp. zooepidemicus (strain H70) TaxID=553483 RepID=C0MEU0_STRS7|nr:hypothetical protein [Streptococcus equi]KIS09978.1 hypothetical protein AT53_00407 [Streptococcus equi subsp. zooepidemicus Sz5]MCD3407707.1 hypothetical protein [Streptococcus equi subsp. zooepidemicus]MCD3411968.1 hypothetical protein [Streptococcus equi subsp. zooepidemicus]MCD3454018.1 hypothetical protein [Streptococcus equi subsp. zooepidemicus]MCD3465116.1 hypothetical protein [Streptococcus equi subsp. zooepidemicus]